MSERERELALAAAREHIDQFNRANTFSEEPELYEVIETLGHIVRLFTPPPAAPGHSEEGAKDAD